MYLQNKKIRSIREIYMSRKSKYELIFIWHIFFFILFLFFFFFFFFCNDRNLLLHQKKKKDGWHRG
jgi:hypothetical protein